MKNPKIVAWLMSCDLVVGTDVPKEPSAAIFRIEYFYPETERADVVVTL